jgi:arylsulfatase
MMRWTLLLVLLGVSALRADERPPNVVLIVADDLGYADLGCYGAKDIRTPHLDQLAADGTRFTNFCVAQAVCTASRAALLSGCYPNRIGMAGALNHTSTTGIHADETLLSELCQARGYATACYGKWHLGTRPAFYPTRHGFDDWFGLPYSNDNGPLHPTIRGIPPLPLIANERVVTTDPDQAQLTNQFTDRAIAFITAQRQRPFFVYVPYVMPHVPIFATPAFRGKSARGLYGDVVEELDAGVGRILATLAQHDLTQSTLVIFLSDNGPFLSYGTHAGRATPFREGKLTTFEGGVRVPFVVRWPGRVPAGRTSADFITGLDVLPTLATAIGAKLPARPLDGQNLLGALTGQPEAIGRSAFAYFAGNELHAVRSGQWKLHLPHDYLTVAGSPGTDGKPANHAQMRPVAIEESGIRGIASRHGYRVAQQPQALYDLTADPGETTDQSATQPTRVAELLRLAERVRADLGDDLTRTPGTGRRPVGVDRPAPPTEK